jgi:hypothetical protein
MLMGVAITGERDKDRKRDEKILKYKDLIIGIQRMWKVKA